MKDQYFGDINDYRKYGLLRALLESSGLRLGVCWLLTAADQRPDGEFRRYLEQPERWRRHDPALYDALQRLRDPAVRRSVGHADAWALLPAARYFGEVLEDGLKQRRAYFARAWDALEDCPLIFFDPDNGLEVKTTAPGRRGSSKYLYWAEAEEAHRRGHSLVIYQHWQRVNRDLLTRNLVESCVTRLGVELVDTFATANVLFILAAHGGHRDGLNRAYELIVQGWAGQITPMAHRR